MSNPIIKVENLSKCYRIGAKEEGYKTFREVIIDVLTAPICNFKRLRKLTKFDDATPSAPNPMPYAPCPYRCKGRAPMSLPGSRNNLAFASNLTWSHKK